MKQRRKRAVVVAVLLVVLVAAYVLNRNGAGGSGTVRAASAHSGPIVISSDGQFVYTSNVDIDTVSIVDTKSRTKVAEIPVGKEPCNLALSPDGRYLYVTAMYDNRVDIIDIRDRKLVRSIPVGIEPFGIVTSSDGSKLYVTNFRSNTISVIDVRNNRVIKEIQVHDNPRALAITADGKKLYVTHFLDGVISVIDTGELQVRKQIKLHESPEPVSHDQKVSQGKPGTVEGIAIDPSGKFAWVTHNLANTDTPIQFESSIFPAVSVIDTLNDEELTEQRKELFKAINIRDANNKTKIVSNPIDISFLPGGEKAYVLFSGSEDVVVFDMRRGSNAVQLVRRVPGDNSRGMVMSPDGSMLYIHNAMSHDLAALRTGGNDPYSQAVVEKETVRLVDKDPLPELVRYGKKIFFSANSEKWPAPITGNNWMSCASCHAGGYADNNVWITPKGPRRTPSNAALDLGGLMMWDGSRDDMGDYILTVQGEMGGMLKLDPGTPLPPDVQKMFDALDAFLKYDRQIPVPKSPYKNRDGTMTASGTAGREVFNKAGCMTCHADPGYTDSNLALDAYRKLNVSNTAFLHDVGTATPNDKGSPGDPRGQMKNVRKPGGFDTPSLLGVYSRAPYFHDGSAKTLEEVLMKPGVHRDQAQRLTEDERKALIEFLKELD